MKNWNKISKKIPKINERIFILSKKLNNIHSARLRIYTKDSNLDFAAGTELQLNDTYWYIDEQAKTNTDDFTWNYMDEYPYWLEKEELIKLIIDKEPAGSSNRFELMDL